MMLRYDPFPLIFAQGDDGTKLACLDFFGLNKSPRAQTYLLALIKQQRSDGTFSSRLDPQHWGMQETVRNALLFLKVGLPPKGLNVQSAVQFILDRQRPDGGWCENPSLVIPPEQTFLSNQWSVTWLTTDVIELLRQAGMRERAEYIKAVNWLRAIQTQDGGWPSLAREVGEGQIASEDPDATAQIAFLMGELYGEDDLVYCNGVSAFERYLDECAQDVERGYRIRSRDGKKEDLEVYHLTHLLLSWSLDPPRRFRSGYDARDPRVKRMMKALVNTQREDGGWVPFWAEESSPVYTAIALKVLILSGMLKREELEGEIWTYAC